MSFLSFFGKGPMSQKKVDKVAKLACNPFAQPDVRMREMQRLLEDGSTAALTGLLKRFAANASGSIADEDEKQYLEDAVTEVGDAVVPPLQQFIRTEKQLTYALRAYERIRGKEEAVRFFIEALERYGPDHHRSGEAKQQLVLQLSEYLADSRVLPALIPFLRDHGDDVRWAVIDMMEAAADLDLVDEALQQKAAAEMIELVCEECGPRIQKRAADVLCRREWRLLSAPEQLAPALNDSFFLDKKKYVRRRVSKN